MKKMGPLLRRRACLSGALLLAGLGCVNLHGQTTDSPQTPKQDAGLPEWMKAASGKMSFEVAAIRPSPPDVPFGGNIQLDALDSNAPTVSTFRTNAPLPIYLIFAFKLVDASQYQELNASLPRWAQSTRYAISARIDGHPTRDQLRLMVQSLLEDRFNLKFHYEDRKVPAYALVLDKPGRMGKALRSHPDDVPCTERPNKTSKLPAAGDPAYCGAMGWPTSDGLLHVRMTNMTMAQIAQYLGAMTPDHRETLDQTGLAGRYDCDLEFKPEPRGNTELSDDDVAGPMLIGALKSQLGLKVIKQTTNARLFVVDHIEPPSEN